MTKRSLLHNDGIRSSRDNFFFRTPGPGGIEQAGGGPYADPYREMLRVAGGGVPYTEYPTFEDYVGWLWQSYYADMLKRGVLFAGGGGAVETPLGLSGGVTYADGRVAQTIAANTPVFGKSGFIGAGIRFGSVDRPLRSRIVFTAAEVVGVRLVYSTGMSGARQLQLLVGFGGGVSVTGSPVAVSW